MAPLGGDLGVGCVGGGEDGGAGCGGEGPGVAFLGGRVSDGELKGGFFGGERKIDD